MNSMIKVIATICRLAAPLDCHDETVTTSNFAEVPLVGCPYSQAPLVEWVKTRPGYKLHGWRCQMGERAERRGI